MNGKARFAMLAALMLLGLLMAGCGGGGGSDEGERTTADGEATEFQFQVTSLPAPTGATGTTASTMDTGPVSFSGALLAVPIGGDPADEQVFVFGVEIDLASLDVITVENIPLPAQAYNFYFLLTSADGTGQLGGVAFNHLILGGATNSVQLILNPIIGVQVANVREFRDLAAFAFSYDPDVVVEFTDPRFGITITGGTVLLFTLNPATDDPRVLLFLPQGEYQFQVRFYDGALLRLVSPETDPVPTSDPNSPTEIVLVPLTAETTYTPSVDSTGETTATFSFTVPTEVVDQVGGPSTPDSPLETRLSAVASVTGALNGLVEQELTLEPVLDADGNITHYRGELTIAGFQPENLTWSLNFIDLNDGDRQIAYCADTADAAGTAGATFVCSLNLLVRVLESTAGVGEVLVTVDDGQPVLGAVVLVNGEPVGLTGNADALAGGGVRLFLPFGDYSITVVHSILDPYGSGEIIIRTTEATPITISLLSAGTTSVTVTLPPVDAPPPPSVTATTPTDGAVGVTLDSPVIVHFSRAMDRASTEAAFAMAPATAGTFGWSAEDTVLTFVPTDPLQASTPYAVTVGAGATDTFGLPLAAAYDFGFTTGVLPDTVAPTGEVTSPADGAINVGVDTVVAVQFSEPMDTGSAEDAFSMTPATTGTFSWSGGGTLMTFLPVSPLAYDTAYSVAVSTAALDAAGNPLAAAIASGFTTGSEPDRQAPTVVTTSPGDGTGGVSVDTRIVIGFSEPMDTTATEAAVRLTPEVAFTKAWSDGNKVLTLTPNDPLAFETAYEVLVTTGAMDTSGNPMAAPYVFGFTTEQAPSTGETIALEPAMSNRPRVRSDAKVDLVAPVTVRIPALQELQVLEGDPNKFLLFLHLGDVKCIYLGGSWDRHIGGVVEDLFYRNFKSPACNRRMGAGDLVTVVPESADGDDRDPDDNDAELWARVVTASPVYPTTRIRIVLEVVTP